MVRMKTYESLNGYVIQLSFEQEMKFAKKKDWPRDPEGCQYSKDPLKIYYGRAKLAVAHADALILELGKKEKKPCLDY